MQLGDPVRKRRMQPKASKKEETPLRGICDLLFPIWSPQHPPSVYFDCKRRVSRTATAPSRLAFSSRLVTAFSLRPPRSPGRPRVVATVPCSVAAPAPAPPHRPRFSSRPRIRRTTKHWRTWKVISWSTTPSPVSACRSPQVSTSFLDGPRGGERIDGDEGVDVSGTTWVLWRSGVSGD